MKISPVCAGRKSLPCIPNFTGTGTEKLTTSLEVVHAFSPELRFID
jgi:hypothetical protein